MNILRRILLVALVVTISADAFGQRRGRNRDNNSEQDARYKIGLSALKFRSVGPAMTSGRISDFAVNPDNPSEYYVATSSGGVWKTTNKGVTFRPIFDRQGSYSIGCITMDPSNHNVIWVGTGENNNQRSVAYGDGVYKSTDGGKSWKNVGLKNSEHVGMIKVDPRDSDVVWVAAYGPLWSAGGDRGIYKTTDGGKTWEVKLEVSENTGFNEIHMDPRDPDLMYAVAHQRRRRPFTLIDGGPESAVYKSTDGGENWTKVMRGMPGGDIGRIGLAVSPANPDVVYAIVEAQAGRGGFYRSTDRGESWVRRNSYTSRGNYYNEIIADPVDVDRVYSMDTFGRVTKDGGATWGNTGERSKHVDNHALWIDPDNPNYLLNGNDGGVYESYDRGATWRFMPNLPITQFYKVATDNAEPFYNIYGGTQDNYSLGGPSQTLSTFGIANEDWYVTLGGDGFESQIDPTNPDIVYSQSQYGNLTRIDLKSGERVSVKPREKEGENAYNWNWDSPFLISPHSHKRLYFAAEKVFKSDDYGNTWEVISPDLSRTDVDRNTLEVMGRVWGMDAVAKNSSTSVFGALVALDESPIEPGLLYAGSDDGLIHVSEDDGANWTRVDKFDGVPEWTYVYDIIASHHDRNVAYAAFNNHRNGDFKPYIYKTTDAGKSWTSITANLPERGSVYAIAEDHVNPNLIFVGTEFSVFFTIDGGKHWKKLSSGLPTIAVRDIEIQKRENDLVLATFGRGFYVMDDYTPLRHLSAEVSEQEAHIFPIKDAKMFTRSSRIGGGPKGFQGETFFTTPNPSVGAKFRYFVKDGVKTKRQLRQEKERKQVKDGEPVKYPTYDELKAEQDEEAPYLLFTIRDAGGEIVRRIRTGYRTGVNELNWDFRFPNDTNVNRNNSRANSNPGSGLRVLPGRYTVSLSKSIDGELTEIVAATPFNVSYLDNRTFPASNQADVLAFQRELGEANKAMNGARQSASEISDRIAYYRAALKPFDNEPTEQVERLIDELEEKLSGIQTALFGDNIKRRLEIDQQPSISTRVNNAVFAGFSFTGNPTTTQRQVFELVDKELTPVLATLSGVYSNDIPRIERMLDDMGAAWTPGRFIEWKKN